MRSAVRRSSRSPVLAGVVLATILFVARVALAEPPAPELMARLALQAAHFETMRTHASYTVDGWLETLDGKGKPSSVKQMSGRMTADGKSARLIVKKYTEDGADKTEEAQRKARERGENRGAVRGLRMPVLAEEQPRYVFDQVEADQADPARVRIAFVPKVREADTIEGSAWVDTRTGGLISAGFKLSKTPMFVDFVHVTVEFGRMTVLGPAISKVDIEGKGGLLFFRKHFRASADLSDYVIVP
jgi:hypothetical protein